MNAQNLLATAGKSSAWPLLLVTMMATTLTACVMPTSIVDSSAESTANAVGGNALLGSDTGSDAGSASERQRQNRLCDRPAANLSPLATPDNTPVFEQFNFQPQSISVSSNEVTVNTTYHTFAYCQKTGEWAIANRRPTDNEPFDYTQYLQDLANPSYETLQIDDQSYAYRVRLQAPWIDEQIKAQAAETGSTSGTSPAASTASKTSTEEAVYFELKAPNGKITTQQLYTLTDVQNASIGASLGVPSIASTVETDEAIWFAATTSQGEGENGFASLLRYDRETQSIDIHQPPEIQGDQITAIVATPTPAQAPAQTTPQTDAQADPNNQTASDQASNPESSEAETTAQTNNEPTLWLGTLRSAEGNPFFPANGLVAYQPTSDSSGTLRQYTIDNSPLVGAIPYQLATTDDELWVATGNGVCQTQWATIDKGNSWRCWRFTATAALPTEGVDLYQSFLAEKPATKLTEPKVEVLWANWEHFDQPDVDKANAFRYEVVYEPGFEVDLAQGGHRLDNKVAQRMARGNDVFWPGQHWHWSGRRFERSLDEVALNLVGGGPYGLIASNIQIGFSFDHYAIRGNFDLLSLKPDGTQVHYYSGWVEGKDLEAYPDIIEVDPVETVKPDPIIGIAADLPPIGP